MRKRTSLQGVAIAMAVCGATALGATSAGAQTFERPGYVSGGVVIEHSPRDVYLDEMGRPYVAVPRETIIVVPAVPERWDTVTKYETYENRGMTPADVSRMTGKVDSSTSGVPMSGSGAQPGNMGPANSKGQ